MKRLLQFLERKLARQAVPHLTAALALGQALVFVMMFTQPRLVPRFYETLALVPNQVLAGEWYRLGSFLILPPGNDILTLFGIYLFYLMGETLEVQWGTVRYNLYLLIAYLATVGVAWFNPAAPTFSSYIGGSVFLAFAWLYPNFVLMIYFVLPVKIKYLALLTWIVFLYTLTFGAWSAKFAVMASVANFLLFFAGDIVSRIRSGKRGMEQKIAQYRRQSQPLHRCTVCGITERDDRSLEFRYCSKCEGSFEYCEIHLKNHEHQSKPTRAA